MGCSDSRPLPEVYDYRFPSDPNVPIIGASHGIKPSTDAPFELVMGKKLFQGSGGNSYMIKYRPAMKDFYDLAVQGKKGAASRDQMDFIDFKTKQAVAICRKSGGMGLDKFKIFTPVPVYEGQKPEIKYGDSRVPMYVFARVKERMYGGGPVQVFLDTPEDAPDETKNNPLYTCRSEDDGRRRYIYKNKRQCAFLQLATNNSIIVKLNPGIDPVLMLCLTAILDEMDDQ